MWHSLVWKEWHEQRWRLGFGVALLAMFTVIGLRTRIMPDEQIIATTILIGGAVFPLMVAMGLIAPERSEGTIVRLFTLPVRPWQVLAAKGLVGGAVCAAPVVVSGLLAALIAGEREMALGDLIGMYAMATGATLAMFTWLAAAGVRQPSEARAGLAGVGVVAAWCLTIAISEMIGIELFADATKTEWIVILSPLGMLELKNAASPAYVIAIQIVMAAVVWGWAARRIGKSVKVVA